jgi:polysaccharide biosynthesis/export protein
MMVKRTLALCFCFIISACSTGKQDIGPNVSATGEKTSSVQTVEKGALPPPNGVDLYQQNRPYLVGPFDKLLIDVFGIEELSNKEVQTDAGGRISFPLAGVIDAAGRTPAEIEAIIEERLRGRFVRNPQVTVNLKETVSQVVTVEGQVKEPGLYPVVGRMTLMRAVATAKGLTDLAEKEDVLIFRTVNGQQLMGQYNLKAIQRGNYDDPEVFANDVVVVGNSSRRQLLKDGIPLFSALASPLIYILTR